MANSIGSAIRSKLIADTLITSLAGTRVYPQKLPQNPTLPAVIYSIISDTPNADVSGMAGLFNADIQIECYAETAQAAQDLSENVRLSLQSYRGTHLSVGINGIYFITEYDAFDDEISNYRRISSYEIWYTRTNPNILTRGG